MKAYGRFLWRSAAAVPSVAIDAVKRSAMSLSVMVGLTFITLVVLASGLTLILVGPMQPLMGSLAFYPPAASSASIAPTDLDQMRRQMLSDSGPMGCLSRTGASARAVPRSGSGASAAPTARPEAVTDAVGQLTAEKSAIVDQMPPNTAFHTAYAYVLTVLNGGVESWRSFSATQKVRHAEAPRDLDASWKVVSLFFSDSRGIHDNDALASLVMYTLVMTGRVPDDPDLVEIFESAVSVCRVHSPEPRPSR